MRDVVPPQDRSIRNIPVPAHRKRPPSREEVDPLSHIGQGQTPISEEGVTEYDDRPRRSRRSALTMWIIAGGVIGILFAVLVSYLFAGATVTINPKKVTAPAGTPVIAQLDAPLGILPYQTVTESLTASRTVPTSGEAQVSRRASGTITISNTYSTSPQRLIKNTRFEAANGKIYRIDTSVEVPGAKKQADGSLSAGTVETTVFADSPGADYNQGPTTFIIPGFKGDPRFTKFSAKSVTPIQNGFVGVERVVSDSDVQAARASMITELSEKTTAALKQSLPEGFLYIAGSERLTSEELPRSTENNGGAVLSMRGTATAAILKAEYLAAALLKSTLSDYGGEAVYFADLSAVSLSSAAPLGPELRGDLSVSLQSPADVLWQFDQEALKNALIGAPASSLQTVLAQFKPSVEQAEASLRPVWTSSFPKDASKIKVIIKK